MSSTQEIRPESSTIPSVPDNYSEHVDKHVCSESKTEAPGNKSEKKKRKKRKKGDPTPQELNTQRLLIDVVERLPDAAMKIFSISFFLRLILPFLKLTLQESVYRFFLGMISFYTNLTNKEIAEIAECSPRLVSRGRTEVAQKRVPCVYRQRKTGTGRKSKMTKEVMAEIKRYVELRSYGPCTQGIQQYTIATIKGCQGMLERKGHHLSRGTIFAYFLAASIRCRMNKKLLYGNQKTETEAQKAIRHAQFDLINEYLSNIDDPSKIILSVDTKKKEILGQNAAKKAGFTLQGKEPLSEDHDFYQPLNVKTLTGMDDLLRREEGKGIPYGIYDWLMNKGYVNIGITSDTPEFVRYSIRRFMPEILKDHPQARELVLLCDGGGSNNSRCTAFRYQMALLSKEIGMKITVIHYPPYRSKFNKIERHLFAFISKNFERSQLINLQRVLDLVRSTNTSKGLAVKAEVDPGYYATGKKPTEEQMNLFSCEYFGPTKDAEQTSKLSYIIDGRTIKDSDIPADRITVFDQKENFDLTKKEKERQKEEKKQAKEKRQKARAEKKACEESAPKVKKKRGRKPKPKSASAAEPESQAVA